jgi:hypothetical protein
MSIRASGSRSGGTWLMESGWLRACSTAGLQPFRGTRAEREGSAAGGLKRHAALDDCAVLLELVNGPVQAGGVHSQLLGDLAHGDTGTLLDQTQDVLLSARGAARAGPPIACGALLRARPPRRGRCADALAVPLPALPSRLDAADRVVAFAARRRRRSGLVDAGGRGPAAGASLLTLKPRRWATCSSSWYSATSGLSSRRRLATCSSAVRN